MEGACSSDVILRCNMRYSKTESKNLIAKRSERRKSLAPPLSLSNTTMNSWASFYALCDEERIFHETQLIDCHPTQQLQRTVSALALLFLGSLVTFSGLARYDDDVLWISYTVALVFLLLVITSRHVALEQQITRFVVPLYATAVSLAAYAALSVLFESPSNHMYIVSTHVFPLLVITFDVKLGARASFRIHHILLPQLLLFIHSARFVAINVLSGSPAVQIVASRITRHALLFIASVAVAIFSNSPAMRRLSACDDGEPQELVAIV